MKNKILYPVYAVLLIFNLATVYLIIRLSGYSEIAEYQDDSFQTTAMPGLWIWVFLITATANLLFISGCLMRSIIFSKK